MHEHHVHGLLAICAALLLGAGAVLFIEIEPSAPSLRVAEVSSVGVAVGVEPNPTNTLAAELDAKEESLRLREAQSDAREKWISEQSPAESNLILYVSLGGTILLLLIIANFYFEYAVHERDKKEIEALAAEVRHGFEV